MSSGQSLLSLGAIVIFMILSMNINKSYLIAIEQTINEQAHKEAINWGQSLAEEVYATDYDQLEAKYSIYNNENSTLNRKEFITATQDTLFATINVLAPHDLGSPFNMPGKSVSVIVFEQTDGNLEQRATYTVAITKF